MSRIRPAINLVHLARVTSTMDVLDGLISAGAPEWTVVLADEQTAGLGRAGRAWEAKPGSSLLCSVLIRPRFPPERIGMLAIAVGVSLAEWLETVGVRVELKWPNDVLLEGRKLAGILIRTRRDAQGVAANVGIGLNLVHGGPESGGRASLDETLGSLPDATEIIENIVPFLARTVHSTKISDVRDAWMGLAASIGESVVVLEAMRTVVGRLVGIDERGALVIESLDGDLLTVAAGDLVRGPRLGSR